jgi:hypothetical protein
MKTELKDAIHFYKGCKFTFVDDDGKYRPTQTLTYYNLNYYREYFDDIKLILRPLSSMTEEEAKEWQDKFRFFISGSPKYINDRLYVIQQHVNLPETRFSSEQFAWLLSKGFDLFNLIENGYAIEKQS